MMISYVGTWPCVRLSVETETFRRAGLSDAEDRYLWSNDLWKLQKESGREVVPCEVGTLSPLQKKLGAWKESLAGHPDQCFAAYIIQGISMGFRIGCDPGVPLRGSSHNLPGALEHKEVVTEYLKKECSLGRIVKPVVKGRGKVHISPFGVIPKKTPGKWRLIIDLSSPRGSSVNDTIGEGVSSLSYVALDSILEAILALGEGVFMGKCDVKEAYRLVPIHPEDSGLLGMQWEGQTFVDLRLPFGLRSAPKIFTAVADAFQWVLLTRGVEWVFHYVDDFIVLGHDRWSCERAMGIMEETAADLGFLLEPTKREGPSRVLSFLGIEIDTDAMEVRLPQAKVEELRHSLGLWLNRNCCVVKDLESLAGKLQHACRVVRPGRCFMRRIFALIGQGRRRKKTGLVRLNRKIQADVWWWFTWLREWNGTSILWSCHRSQPDEEIWSDASGSWGCGAWWGTKWFQLKWAKSLKDSLEEGREDSIAERELIPVVIAAAVWGSRWQGKVVHFLSDNIAVVRAINRVYSSCDPIMHLIRCLVYYAAKDSFWFGASHIPGAENIYADHLSRNRLDLFLSSFPQGVGQQGTPIPTGVAAMLDGKMPLDWRSEVWIKQFQDTSTKH